jgi:zinc transport system permease protein
VIDALDQPFLQRALLAGLLASVACGLIGSYVVAKRISSLTGGLAHAAFGGVGLGYLAGFPPLLGATGFALLAALLVGEAQRRLGEALETWVSIVWSVGMALGIVFVALAPGYAPDLMSYLFGSLLFVSWETIAWIVALDVLILGSVAVFHPLFEAVCFDEEYAEVAGVRAEAVFLGLMGLTALAIVTVIRVVGVILAIALLTLPATTARHWTSSLRGMMALSVALSAASIVGGLVLAQALGTAFGVSVPPGPLAILLAAVVYAASSGLQRRTAATPPPG